MEKFNLLCGVKRVQNCFSGHQHPGLCDLPEPRVGREGVCLTCTHKRKTTVSKKILCYIYYFVGGL